MFKNPLNPSLVGGTPQLFQLLATAMSLRIDVSELRIQALRLRGRVQGLGVLGVGWPFCQLEVPRFRSFGVHGVAGVC